MNVTALIVARKIVPTNTQFAFLTLNNGETIVAPVKESEGQVAVTYAKHRAGDKFTATRDSRTIVNGNPAYLKGEEVTRLKDSTEVLGYCSVEVFKALN